MAYCNTIFHQMLKIVPRHVFGTLDKVRGTGRKARTFSHWDQFVHLMLIQLTGRASLRDGVGNCCEFIFEIASDQEMEDVLEKGRCYDYIDPVLKTGLDGLLAEKIRRMEGGQPSGRRRPRR